MEEALRAFFLQMAQNRVLSDWAKRYGLRYGANRFVAGETIESAMDTVRMLNENQMDATLDHLGEFVANEVDAKTSANFCLQTLQAIYDERVNASLSVKLTQLGLDIRKSLCLDHMRYLLDYASSHGIWVNIDMEDFAHCEVTLDIFRTLFASYEKVQTVIQAYLYRSETDVEELANMGASVRIVKGAYKESESVAYPNKADVDSNYIRLLDIHLPSAGLTSIATHDVAMITHAKRVIEKQGLSRNQYEFQMLYGIRNDLQAALVEEGYPVRIYVPYGNDWYGYFMRRLAERPANVGFVLRGVFH